MELKESLTSSAVHATLSGLELRSLVSASADYSFPGEPQWKKERRQEMARAISVANSCLEREPPESTTTTTCLAACLLVRNAPGVLCRVKRTHRDSSDGLLVV